MEKAEDHGKERRSETLSMKKLLASVPSLMRKTLLQFCVFNHALLPYVHTGTFRAEIETSLLYSDTMTVEHRQGGSFECGT